MLITNSAELLSWIKEGYWSTRPQLLHRIVSKLTIPYSLLPLFSHIFPNLLVIDLRILKCIHIFCCCSFVWRVIQDSSFALIWSLREINKSVENCFLCREEVRDGVSLLLWGSGLHISSSIVQSPFVEQLCDQDWLEMEEENTDYHLPRIYHFFAPCSSLTGKVDRMKPFAEHAEHTACGRWRFEEKEWDQPIVMMMISYWGIVWG